MDRDLEIADTKQRILNTFKYYTQGPSVPSDGNCGLHAICKALGDGLYMAGSNIKPKSLMLKICCMFGLENLPNYWWSDEELAVIANGYGYDMYIYNETDRTGIVFGKGIRPPLVLYSVNNNSHWIPGMRTVIPSSCIPENFTIIENISEVLSIRQIKIKIKLHLMRSMNPNGGCIESYSGRSGGSRSSSNGRHSSRRHNGSRSGGREERRDGSHHERNYVSRNKKRDESRSGGRDGVRIIIRQDWRRPQLEKDHGREVKGSHSAGEKESRNGGKIRSHGAGEKKSHNGGKIGSHGGGEKGSNSGEEKSISRKSDEKLLVPYSSTVNGDRSYGMDAVRLEFNLYAKLKNTVLSKMIRQLYHWNWTKKNKYNKLDFDTEDEDDDSEDKELNTMYNARYTIMRDVFHHFVSKKERKLLVLEACDALMALQSLEATMTQLEPIKCSELVPVEVECHNMEDVKCCQIVAVEYSPIATVDCCSIGAIDCCSNAAVYCPYKIYDCPFISGNCPCDIDDCPFTSPEYPFSDQWVSDKYVNDLVDGYSLERNKIKGTRLFDRVYRQAVSLSNDIIVRCIIKPKRVVNAPPAVASVLVAPAVVASMVTASVVASPAMAAWMVAAPGLSSSVMQVAPAVVAPAMVDLMMAVPEVAAPTIAVEVVPLGNDQVTVPVDNDFLATPMKDNLTMTSVGNDLVVKPNACVKRYFSLKKIWKKKTKTQHSKDH